MFLLVVLVVLKMLLVRNKDKKAQMDTDIHDISGTCIYLASRAGNYTNGATIVIDGGAIQNNSRM